MDLLVDMLFRSSWINVKSVFVCYLFAFVRRLIEVLGFMNPPYWLAVVHISTSSLLGFGNAIVYGAVNSRVRYNLSRNCCRASGNPEGRHGLSKDSIIQMEAEVGHNQKIRAISRDAVEINIDE